MFRVLGGLAAAAVLLCGGCDEGTSDPVDGEQAGGKADEVDTEGDTEEGDLAWEAFLEDAADPDLRFVAIPDTPRPVGQYVDPSAEDYFLHGPEFWERWTGGDTKEFNENNATDAGLKCAIAAATRWTVLHDDPPEEFAQMRQSQNWEGTYFNWIEDVSEGGEISFATGWWAWRTGTMKFISTVHPDGTCEMPTRDLMRRTGEVCQARGEANGGATEGCRTVH